MFGCARLLQRVAAQCGIPLQATILPEAAWQDGAPIGAPTIVDCQAGDVAGITPGRVAANCGQAAYHYIRLATEAALAGHTAAIVTAPINKESLHAAGIPHPGHTECITELTGAHTTRMMMASEPMLVTLATLHIALADVPAQLTTQGILDSITLTHATLLRLGIAHPRITVCGLNPHAGEGGQFGNEEARCIAPAVALARSAGICVTDPLPPDTAFTPARRATTDAFIAMYHDQGLIPFKMLAFETGVNITLGLPIVRTSVDHGTAFDIAWTGQASPDSLHAAIRWALRLNLTREAGDKKPASAVNGAEVKPVLR